MRLGDRRAQAGAFAAGLVVAAAGVADAGTESDISCSYDPATRVLTVNYEHPASAPGVERPHATAVIGRRDREIAVREVVVSEISADTFPRPCSGRAPTVDNVDRIDLRSPSDNVRSLTFFQFDQGRLGPGATPEAGGSEIEIDADLGVRAAYVSLSSKRRRSFTLGTSGTKHLVNFNSAERSPDADLVLHSEPADLYFDGSPRSDLLSAAGGNGTGGPFRAPVLLSGEGGDDLVVGSAADDDLIGGGGDDTVRGLPGDDALDVNDRDGADRLLCGPGDDRVGADAHDRVRGCEQRPPPP
jgi:hypothetical protein